MEYRTITWDAACKEAGLPSDTTVDDTFLYTPVRPLAKTQVGFYAFVTLITPEIADGAFAIHEGKEVSSKDVLLVPLRRNSANNFTLMLD